MGYKGTTSRPTQIICYYCTLAADAVIIDQVTAAKAGHFWDLQAACSSCGSTNSVETLKIVSYPEPFSISTMIIPGEPGFLPPLPLEDKETCRLHQ